jgi:membrane-bound lytic murein transglycosylase B
MFNIKVGRVWSKTFLFLVLLVSGYGASHAFALSDSDFQKIGSRYGISPYLLLAISIVESQKGELQGRHEVKKVVNNTQLKFLRKIAAHTGRDISKFKGSYAGAMGYMQIMPSTFYTYGQDGNGDGVKDPLDPIDSLATAAYFLAHKIALKDNNIAAALKKYNNSGVYSRKVLKLSQKLELERTFASSK